MAKEEVEYDVHEQSERARAWFERNGSSIVIGVLAAVTIIWGYQGWQGGKQREAERASMGFEALNKAIADKQDAKVAEASLALRRDFPRATYTAAGSMTEARYLLDQGKLDPALQALRGAVETGSSEEVKAIARLRIARLLLAKKDYPAALAELDKVGSAFKIPKEELRGDILLQQGKRKEAFQAYDAALSGTDLAAPGRSTLQTKRDNLSGS